jgi:TRAP-type C4-dicarboxylate transport system permease small subunit
MFWLTHPVCQGWPRSSIVVVGLLCIAIAVVGGLLAWRQAKRARSAEDDISGFLCEIALWSAAIFTLVIALSLVPAGLLTPCPV